MAWRELRAHDPPPPDPFAKPGMGQGLVDTHPDTESQHGRQYHSQHARKAIDGVLRRDLPELVIKGCPHCGGDLCKEHEDFGYGDYSCKDCGRAWDVASVARIGGRWRITFGRVGHYLDQTPPKRKRRGKYGYD